MSKISIIIPTYNEAENISDVLIAIDKAATDRQVIVVDDNSPDGTAEIVRKLSSEFHGIELLSRPRKMGLGSAYKDGLKACSGSIVVEMDADLSHDPFMLLEMVKALETADMVVGSRYIDGGKIVGWGYYRKATSSIANFLARTMLGLRVRDVTSGFRAYRREVFERIVALSRFDGYEFQVEAVYIAKKLGFRISEFPITFTDRRRGKSKLSFFEFFRFLKALIAIRFRSKITE